MSGVSECSAVGADGSAAARRSARRRAHRTARRQARRRARRRCPALFGAMLKEAERQYGFKHQDAIAIPCRVDRFVHVDHLIDRDLGTHHSDHFVDLDCSSGGEYTQTAIICEGRREKNQFACSEIRMDVSGPLISAMQHHVIEKWRRPD